MGRGDLVGGEENDGGDVGGCAVGGEGGGGVAGGGAADAHKGGVQFAEAIDLAYQNRHPQILEASGVADSAVFDPQIVHSDEFLTESLGPEEIGVPLEGADDVVVVDLGQNPFLLGPDAGAVRPARGADARVEEGSPVVAVELLEGVHIMLDVEEAAVAAAVDYLVE